MLKALKSRSRSRRFLAVVAALGIVACAEGESREAPEDAADAQAEAPAAEAPPAPEATEAEETPTERATPAMTVPEGTSMTFAVDQQVSTETHAVGDRFIATLANPVSSADGRTALDAGTPSRWVVTESTTEGGQALLAFELESVEVNGEWTAVPATVTQTDIETDDPDTGGETAAKIGVGTAAGAIIGQILGSDTESTLKGAGVGAAVGTAVALATRGGSATVPAGSALTVELRDDLSVR